MKTTTERRRNGQFSEANETMCVCGHRKGQHLAEAPFAQEDPFECAGFKKAKEADRE